MTTIKDSVHDYIELDPTAEALLDTAAMQRLRTIRQLSTVQLVYPSANHTRFEHSLGVYHLASRAVDRLEVDEPLAERLRAAALVHDVGHGPFGHQTEAAIERHIGRHHDEIEWLLADSEIGAVLENHGLEPEAVAATVDGRGPLGELVSGSLDVDRMDYLVRDAHHTGVPYGTIDHARLLYALRIVDGELALEAGNVATAESALIARTLMNATVYRHHVSRIAGAMLDRASERLLADGHVNPDRFARLTDAELLATFADYEPTADMATRIRERDLYKRAIWRADRTFPTDSPASSTTEHALSSVKSPISQVSIHRQLSSTAPRNRVRPNLAPDSLSTANCSDSRSARRSSPVSTPVLEKFGDSVSMRHRPSSTTFARQQRTS